MGLVLGLDFGTDSARCAVVDTESGEVISTATHEYAGWSRGRYCDAANHQFRQHPGDHIEALTESVRSATSALNGAERALICAIGVDSTGSTPVALCTDGVPLALTESYANDPCAMFWLWKDHTALAEAEEITSLSKSWGGKDFTAFSGGDYSPEWYWAKLLRFLRNHRQAAADTATWVEHGDWIVALLTGRKEPGAITRNRCAAGHKGMWHESWGGWPSTAFLDRLHPDLSRIAATLPRQTPTSDKQAGTITPNWAKKLGLTDHVIVSVAQLDAHAGAVGGGIRPGQLVKVIGTSTCDMAVTAIRPESDPIPGIAGEVDGSILPGLIGVEAGQAAFGDVYRWFRDLLNWPVRHARDLGVDLPGQLIRELDTTLLGRLDSFAAGLESTDVIAVDWFNGRRSPFMNMHLSGHVHGLRLGTSAPELFKGLVEGTVFGARRIVEHLEENGIDIESITAVGGIAKHSPFVMQTLADGLNRQIDVADSDQTCALGAAISAAIAAGRFASIDRAQHTIATAKSMTLEPRAAHAHRLDRKYLEYLELGSFQEHFPCRSVNR